MGMRRPFKERSGIKPGTVRSIGTNSDCCVTSLTIVVPLDSDCCVTSLTIVVPNRTTPTAASSVALEESNYSRDNRS
jgi:hypothetical protein